MTVADAATVAPSHATSVAGGLDTVIGQAAASEALRRAVANDEVGHAFLLVGPAGVGQDQIVRMLAAGLNCASLQPHGRPCGACRACQRIARDTHPAVVTFAPVGVAHLVDPVRTLWIPTASRTLVDGVRRVIHVVAADRMNEAAQNAFLKVLEEPPPSTVWVLDAVTTDPLLDTIVSRCRRVDLRPWGSDDLAVHAAGLGVQDADAVEVLVRAAQGSPLRLTSMVCDMWEWTCPACDQVTRLHGVPRATMPSHCTNDDCESVREGAPAPLVRSDVDQTARSRHLHVVERFATEGAVAVGRVAREVTSWATDRAAAVAAGHGAQLERLAAEGGVDDFKQLPASVRTPVLQRQKREVRQATLEAITSFLDDLGSYLRDLVAVGSGVPSASLVNLDVADRLRRDAALVPVGTALTAISELAGAREAVMVHSAQPQLQVEAILMPVFVTVYASQR